MVSTPATTLTKSDFLLFCEAPRHVWAKHHDQLTGPLSDMNRLTGEQGYQVEALARAYLEQMVQTGRPDGRLSWQATFTDGAFEARVDALLYKPAKMSVTCTRSRVPPAWIRPIFWMSPFKQPF